MDSYLKKAIEMYPNAKAELIYHNDFEFLVCVMLSAQTTDKSVNGISGELFAKFPSYNAVKETDYDEIYRIIEPLGLAKNKTKNLILLCKQLQILGKIPASVDELVKLPGVGIKTASVYMGEIHHEPHIAVDTHVKRVANRLGLVDTDDVNKIQKALENRYKPEEYIKCHHTFLFLGRYKCKSQKPDCGTCLLKNICKYYKNNN